MYGNNKDHKDDSLSNSRTTSQQKDNDETEAIAEYNLPFGPLSFDRGYAYIDRIGYRIPTSISDTADITNPSSQPRSHTTTSNGTSSQQRPSKKRNKRPIQRSLTPHLDCCPSTFLSPNLKTTQKWRPLQSFISLTDTQKENTGGFEAAPGFHHQFSQWAQTRPPSIITTKTGDSKVLPPPCVGDFTPLRPKEDASVLRQIRHIGCGAGAVVIWDLRIPHGNARYNKADVARAVVYASFLPDVEVNRRYVARQLRDFMAQKKPGDQWVNGGGVEEEEVYEGFTVLGRRLMGIDPWKGEEEDDDDERS